MSIKYLLFIKESHIKIAVTPAAAVTYPSAGASGRVRPAVSTNVLPAAEPEPNVRHNVHRLRPRTYDHSRTSGCWGKAQRSGTPHAPRGAAGCFAGRAMA